MTTLRALWMLPIALLHAGVVLAVLPPPERIMIPSLETNATGNPTQVPALLFRPGRVAPGAAVPLVVGLHGCGGLYSTRAGHEDALSQRFSAWTQQFLDDGYAVLWPDSFTPRGRREVCTIKMGDRSITAATRRQDALGALAFASTLPGVDRQRIAIVGWSHGGSTTLATINGMNKEVASFRARAGATPFFRAAVTFYPGCAAPLKAGAHWRPATPIAIHIGEADDWTPAAPCVELAEAMRGIAPPLTLHLYAGSYHGFDAPSGRVTVLTNIPNGVNPGRGVTNGPNPVARTAAIASVRSFLREQLAANAAGGAAAYSGNSAETPSPARPR